MQIILARLDDDIEVVPGKWVLMDRYNYRPATRPCQRAVALTWLLDGTPADLAAAQTFAGQHGYRVFVYQPDVDDVLGQAKADIVAQTTTSR